MRRIHLAVGVLTVLAFALTGQLMRHHAPPLASLSDATRLLYRSRHIYILASGLVNLMLGLYMELALGGWRAVVQRIGSGLLLASALLLIAAFAVEPQRGFQAEMRSSAVGLFAMFGGSLLHFVSGIGRRGGEKPSEAARA